MVDLVYQGVAKMQGSFEHFEVLDYQYVDGDYMSIALFLLRAYKMLICFPYEMMCHKETK